VLPLRERREDIPELALHFLKLYAQRSGKAVTQIEDDALAVLKAYAWPGNIRQLENAIERALVLGSASSILVEDLPEAISEAGSSTGAPVTKYAGAMKDTKKQVILQALREARGDYFEAAKTLGLHPNSLLRLIRQLNLRDDLRKGAGG